MSNNSVSKEGLVRGIRRWDLVAVTINGIIGAGIFGLPAKTYALIGTYSLLAFIACALVVTLIILCFAEVGSRFEETGGPYLYAREAFGPTVAFEVGWLIWLARLTAFAANCNLMVSYIGFFWPSATSTIPRALIITGVVSALTALNITGVRQAAIASNVFTIGKLIPLLIFIAAGLFFLNPGAFTLGAAPSTGAFSQSVLLLIYAFTGFEMAAIPAGETKDPRRDLPRALLIAIGVVAVVYVLIQVVSIGTLPGLANSTKPLADAGQQFLGTAGGALISAGAIISITGNLNIILLSGSRVPFAIAEQKQLPEFVGNIHRRFSTPHVSILITAAIMFILTLNSSFVAALTISAIARLVTYAATCLALPVLRQKKDVPEAVFRVFGGSVVAIACLVLIVWLLLNSTLYEAIVAAIGAVVGLGVFVTTATGRAMLHRDVTSFFSMKGRLDRATYFWKLLAINILTQIVAFKLVVFLGMTMAPTIGEIIVGIIGAIIGVAGMVVSAFQVVKRLHDLDEPGTRYWLLLVPLYNIYLASKLFFKKGTDGPNQYGKDPLAR